MMVIEDEREIRDLVRYKLERAGFRVAVAPDGKQSGAALRLLRSTAAEGRASDTFAGW